MELAFLVGAIPASMVALGLGLIWRRGRRWRNTAMALCAARDLQVEGRIRASSRLRATREGFTVEAYIDYEGGEGHQRHCTFMRTSPVLSPQIQMRVRPRRAPADRLLTGDVRFDDAIWVEGPPVELRAALSAQTRADLLGALDGTLTVENGAVRWKVAGLQDLQVLVEKFDQICALATALQVPNVPVALAEIGRTDQAVVAAEALRCLPNTPERAAIDAAIVEIREDAAALVSATRIEDMDAVARIARQRNNPGDVRIQALQSLDNTPLADAVARTCLDPPAVAAHALALVDSARPLPFEQLRPFLVDPEAAAAAVVHACLHRDGVEAFLVEALQSAGLNAAIDALSIHGARSAVLALRTARDTVTRAQRKSIDAAIAAIQERIGGAMRGALSASAVQAGELSET